MNEAALGAPAGDGWIIRLVRLPNILVDPDDIFTRERASPNALIPLVVLVIGFASLLSAYSSIVVNLALANLPAGERADLAPGVSATVNGNKWVAFVLTPLYVGASALAVGLLVYAVAAVTAPTSRGDSGGMHQALSVAAYASLIILLEQLLTYATIRVIGIHNVHYFWDLKPLPGLHYFVQDPDNHRVAFAALERINPFTVGYGAVLMCGMRSVFATSRLASLATATAAVGGELAFVTLIAVLKP
jgi:hypothetical protein